MRRKRKRTYLLTISGGHAVGSLNFRIHRELSRTGSRSEGITRWTIETPRTTTTHPWMSYRRIDLGRFRSRI